MSVLGIVVIVLVVAAILFALFVLLPRMREKGRVKKRELELRQRRKQVISEQREEADSRTRQAEIAEQRARMAEQEARRERAEAELRQQRATLHEEGMADHELIEEHERERFAGTSAVSEDEAESGGRDGRRERTSAYGEGRRAAHDPTRAEDFQQGQQEEEHSQNGGLLGRFRRRKEGQPAGRQ